METFHGVSKPGLLVSVPGLERWVFLKSDCHGTGDGISLKTLRSPKLFWSDLRSCEGPKIQKELDTETGTGLCLADGTWTQCVIPAGESRGREPQRKFFFWGRTRTSTARPKLGFQNTTRRNSNSAELEVDVHPSPVPLMLAHWLSGWRTQDGVSSAKLSYIGVCVGKLAKLVQTKCAEAGGKYFILL